MNIRASLPLIQAMRDNIAPYQDDDLLHDCIEGETDAMELLDAEIDAMLSDDALVAAMKAREAEMAARRKRIESRSLGHRRNQRMILDAMGLRRVERPLATISVRAGSVSVSITDKAAVPTQLCKVEYKPDLTAIRAQIEAGEAVPGAELVRGEDGVTVRVK